MSQIGNYRNHAILAALAIAETTTTVTTKPMAPNSNIQSSVMEINDYSIKHKTAHLTRAQRREIERKQTMQSNRKRKW